MATKRQKRLHRLVEVAAHIWNHAIAVHRTYYRLFGKHLPKARLQAHLAKLKHVRWPHWAELNSQAVQQVADRLVAGHDNLVFETLSMAGMKARWGRKVSDYAFSAFINKTAWLAAKNGRKFIQIDRFELTTKKCSCCGHIQPLTLEVRRWSCVACMAIHDRDQNAAVNILEAGRGLWREGAVRPAPQAALVNNAESHRL